MSQKKDEKDGKEKTAPAKEEQKKKTLSEEMVRLQNAMDVKRQATNLLESTDQQIARLREITQAAGQDYSYCAKCGISVPQHVAVSFGNWLCEQHWIANPQNLQFKMWEQSKQTKIAWLEFVSKISTIRFPVNVDQESLNSIVKLATTVWQSDTPFQIGTKETLVYQKVQLIFMVNRYSMMAIDYTATQLPTGPFSNSLLYAIKNKFPHLQSPECPDFVRVALLP